MYAKMVAIVILAIIGTIAVVMILGGGIPFSLNGSGGGSNSVLDDLTPQPVDNSDNLYKNKVTFDLTISNVGNDTSITSDGNPMIIKYYEKSPDGTTFSHIVDDDTDVDNTAEFTIGNNKVIYALVEYPTTPVPPVYLDVAETISANDEIKSGTTDFTDTDRNNRPSHLFAINLSEVTGNPNPQLQPSILWGLKVHGDGDVDINTASSLASVGQGTIENTVDWELTFDAQPNAYAISAVDLRFNATSNDNYFDEGASWVDIPNKAFDFGVERVFLSDMAETTNSGVTTYRHEYCNAKQCTKYDGSNLIVVGNSGSKKLDIPVTITTLFDATNEALCVEISIDKIDSRNVVSPDEMIDDMEIAEGAVGAECTI